MCICERIYNNWRNIIQTWIGIWAIYFANKIAQEQIKLSNIQINQNIWQLKVENAKFAIESAKNDLDRMMAQHTFIYNEKFNKDSDYKDNIQELLETSDAMLWIAHQDIQEFYDKYNNLIENNPMNYETTDVETISSKDKTLEELKSYKK